MSRKQAFVRDQLLALTQGQVEGVLTVGAVVSLLVAPLVFWPPWGWSSAPVADEEVAENAGRR